MYNLEFISKSCPPLFCRSYLSGHLSSQVSQIIPATKPPSVACKLMIKTSSSHQKETHGLKDHDDMFFSPIVKEVFYDRMKASLKKSLRKDASHVWSPHYENHKKILESV